MCHPAKCCCNSLNGCIKWHIKNLSSFLDSGCLLPWIFYKFEILTAGTVWRANVHHHAKFHANRSNCFGDMAVFYFFKMAAVRHLVFVVRLRGPPTKSSWWSLLLCGCLPAWVKVSAFSSPPC